MTELEQMKKCNQPSCIACYGGNWYGIYPPTCISRLNQNVSDHPYRIQSTDIPATTPEFEKRFEALEKSLSIHEASLNRKWQANSELSERIEALEKENPRLWNTEQTGIINHERISKLEKERDLGVERIKKLEESMKFCENWIIQYCKNHGDDIEKKEGLTFVEALKYFYEGKKIKRKHWESHYFSISTPVYLETSDLLENDWMVLDD